MFVLLVSVKLTAQSDKVFHTYIYNDEFKINSSLKIQYSAKQPCVASTRDL